MTVNIQKAPSENEDFTLNWATRGLGSDTIATSSWSLTPGGLTISATSNTTTTTTVWLSGGTAGQVYTLTNTIITSGGRTFQQEITCFVYQ